MYRLLIERFYAEAISHSLVLEFNTEDQALVALARLKATTPIGGPIRTIITCLF